MAGNIPIGGPGPTARFAVVAYGATTMDGTRDVIACEELAMGANAITLLGMGLYRTDYPAGSLCLDHAPAP